MKSLKRTLTNQSGIGAIALAMIFVIITGAVIITLPNSILMYSKDTGDIDQATALAPVLEEAALLTLQARNIALGNPGGCPANHTIALTPPNHLCFFNNPAPPNPLSPICIDSPLKRNQGSFCITPAGTTNTQKKIKKPSMIAEKLVKTRAFIISQFDFLPKTWATDIFRPPIPNAVLERSRVDVPNCPGNNLCQRCSNVANPQPHPAQSQLLCVRIRLCKPGLNCNAGSPAQNFVFQRIGIPY